VKEKEDGEGNAKRPKLEGRILVMGDGWHKR